VNALGCQVGGVFAFEVLHRIQSGSSRSELSLIVNIVKRAVHLLFSNGVCVGLYPARLRSIRRGAGCTVDRCSPKASDLFALVFLVFLVFFVFFDLDFHLDFLF